MNESNMVFIASQCDSVVVRVLIILGRFNALEKPIKSCNALTHQLRRGPVTHRATFRVVGLIV